MKLTFDGQPVFGIAYNVTNDVIIENAPKLEGTKTFTNVENLAQNKRLEIQLNFPIKLGKIIDGFGGNQAIYNAYDAEYLGQPYTASRWHWLAYWQINASLAYDVKLEFGGFYMTKFLEEFVTIDPLLGANLGISKSFADKKGMVSLSWNDIFYKQNANISAADPAALPENANGRPRSAVDDAPSRSGSDQPILPRRRKATMSA